jgi:hypothetical protein
MSWPGPKDYPRCKHCGHEAQYHGSTFCIHDFGSSVARKCDCPGWERDPGWPPKTPSKRPRGFSPMVDGIDYDSSEQ